MNKHLLVLSYLVFSSCGAGLRYEDQLGPVVRGPEPIAAGRLEPGGCTSPTGKLLLNFQTPGVGSTFCGVLLFRKGEPARQAFALTGLDGYGLLAARGAAFCEDLEAPDGGLHTDRGVALDEIWGTIEPGFELNGRLRNFTVREDAGLRVGRLVYDLNPGFISANNTCTYP
ncbi:MAG: hypothetical protein ABTQ32_04310 [Myxococcaceae bacterium]